VETDKETQVNVFVPPTYMYVETSLIPVFTPADRNVSDPVLVSCYAGPAFPRPTLSLYWTQHQESRTTTTPASITESEGLFSAMLNVSIPGDSVGTEDVVSCIMELPGTGWTRTEETEMVSMIYYADIEEAMELEAGTEDNHTLGFENSTEVVTSNITGDVTDYDFISTSDLDRQSEEFINLHDIIPGLVPVLQPWVCGVFCTQ